MAILSAGYPSGAESGRKHRDHWT
jgi:hypothetical protein